MKHLVWLIPVAAFAFLVWLHNAANQVHMETGMNKAMDKALAEADTTRQVILKRDPTRELFVDDGAPVSEAIRRRQASASARDNHTSLAIPVKYNY